MTFPTINPFQSAKPRLAGLGSWLVLGLTGLAAASHPGAAEAASQYCTFSVPCGLSPGFVSNGDTYFWSPSTAPPPAATITVSAPLTPLSAVRQLTLRGNNTISAFGNSSQSNVLIGSLGNDRLNGNGGNDYYIVGKETVLIASLASCAPAAVGDCLQLANSGAGVESDQVTLNPGTDIVWIDKCLQSTANFAISATRFARGGDRIYPPTGAAASIAGRPMPAIPTLAACVPGIADSRGPLPGAPSLARLLSWQTLWQQSSRWLQSALASLTLTSPAKAWPLPWAKSCANQCAIPGVPRIIQSANSGFGGERGDRINLDQASLRFNNAPLSEGNKTVYLQSRAKESIPLGKGIALVYHQELGLLASYANDRSAYGTAENPGRVIAQLVDPSGRPLSSGRGTLNRAALNWVDVEDVKSLPPAPGQPIAANDRPAPVVPNRR
jgi:hypothetical protein